MKPNLLPRAFAVLSLSVILTGCGATTRNAEQVAAGVRIGAAAAIADTPRAPQPEQCGQDFPLLDVPLGQDVVVVWKRYEDYLVNVINPSRKACWLFNENAR